MRFHGTAPFLPTVMQMDTLINFVFFDPLPTLHRMTTTNVSIWSPSICVKQRYLMYRSCHLNC